MPRASINCAMAGKLVRVNIRPLKGESPHKANGGLVRIVTNRRSGVECEFAEEYKQYDVGDRIIVGSPADLMKA